MQHISKFINYLNNIKEAKQVGIIYHFTTIDSIKMLLNKKKMEEYGCEILTFLSNNSHLSTTRDYMLVNSPLPTFNVSKYNIRIAINGDKLSNKYKIKPINGLHDNSKNIFGTELNFKRVKHKSEKEEVILCPKSGSFKLKEYIEEIQIYNHDEEASQEIFNTIKDIINLEKLNIKVTRVRKWTPFNEKYIDDKYFDVTNKGI